MLAIVVSSSAFPVKTYETAKQSRNPRLSLAAKAVTLVVAFNTTMLVVAAASPRIDWYKCTKFWFCGRISDWWFSDLEYVLIPFDSSSDGLVFADAQTKRLSAISARPAFVICKPQQIVTCARSLHNFLFYKPFGTVIRIVNKFPEDI